MVRKMIQPSHPSNMSNKFNAQESVSATKPSVFDRRSMRKPSVDKDSIKRIAALTTPRAVTRDKIFNFKREAGLNDHRSNTFYNYQQPPSGRGGVSSRESKTLPRMIAL